MKKVLIIRFSSIGDIVLTSPVVRILKQEHPEMDVHFLTKSSFKDTLIHNPHIAKLHLLDENNKAALREELRTEKFDYIIDLQKNNKSKKIINYLKTPFKRVNKLNIRKWLFVQFKWNTLPSVHIVDRYLDTASFFELKNDQKGLDYFLSPEEEQTGLNFLQKTGKYTAIAIGAAHNTKQIPVSKIREIIQQNPRSTFVLLGGKEDVQKADEITQHFDHVLSFAGKCSLNESAAILKHADSVITGDTGLMHIAAAFQKKIFSLWGNTVPDFGMYPYMPHFPERNIILENNELNCRPCSKLGKKKCPKGHFKCMLDLDIAVINTQ